METWYFRFECDVVETCNGSTSVCPLDRRLNDGSKCFKNEPKLPGRCLGKNCVSHEKQCKEKYGEASRAPAPDEKIECLDKSGRERGIKIGECDNLICVVDGNNQTDSTEQWKLSNGWICLRPKYGRFSFVKALAGTECEGGGTCSYVQGGHSDCQNTNGSCQFEYCDQSGEKVPLVYLNETNFVFPYPTAFPFLKELFHGQASTFHSTLWSFTFITFLSLFH